VQHLAVAREPRVRGGEQEDGVRAPCEGAHPRRGAVGVDERARVEEVCGGFGGVEDYFGAVEDAEGDDWACAALVRDEMRWVSRGV
jgi:hypothetical protein